MEQFQPSTPKKKIDGLAAARALWSIGDLEYLLWPQQRPIYAGARALLPSVSEAVFLCSRQFGKSFLGVILAVEDCLRFPNCCILIIGPTLKQTVGIVAPRLREIARDAPEGLVQQQKSESKWIIGSSELVIGGMDISSSSQRGKTLQNVYVEEIVDSNPDDYMEALRSDIGPALTHSKGGRIVFLTTPPKIPDHPFLLETVPKARLNQALFEYTIYDNKKLSQEQFRRCAELAGCILDDQGNITYKSVDWLREYEVKAVRDERVTVIPDFNRAQHVRAPSFPPEFSVEVFIDWGGVRDKTVALLTFYSFHANRLCVIDERVFPNNTSTAAIVEECRRLEAPFKDRLAGRWADAPGQLQVDLEAAGYSVKLPLKQDWQAAVNNLQVMFRQGRIEVDPRCKFLIASLESGQFNKQRNDFARTETLGHLDAIAALMYASRCFDRSNPYPARAPGYDQFRIVREEPVERQLASSIQPKTFMRRGFR